MVAPAYTRRAKLRDRRIQRDALRTYWTALAKRESAPVDIVCIGDSLTEGSRTTAPYTGRWVERLRDKLRTRYPVTGVTGGRGYLCANYHAIGTNAASEANQIMTQTGGSTDASYLFGLGRRYRKLTTTGDKVAVTVTCSSFDAVYTQGTGRGVLGIKIDGGAVTQVTTGGSLNAGKRVNSGALTPGSHTIELSWVSGGEVDVEGIMVFNGDETKGIRVWEGGHGGFKSGDFNGAFWNGATNGSLFNIQPALVTIDLGTNDLLFNTGNNWPSSAVKGNVETLIAAATAACTVAPSILLIVPHQAAGSYTEPWSNYVDALWSVAIANPTQVAIVDLTDLMGTATRASGLFDQTAGNTGGDLIHVNDLGSEFWANAIANALEP